MVQPGGQASYQSHVFAGAKVVQVVNPYNSSLHIDRFDLLIDWGWFYFLTKPLFWLIDHIQRAVGHFGLAILMVTVLVKALFFPLAYKSYVSMSQMKKLQPGLQKLKERFPDDRARQQKEMMELYKREKVSPLSGCVPIVLQIPVFFALYKVLFVTIEMRHAPFYGWIRDLSAPDPTTVFNLFGLIPWTPPHFLMIGVLPLIMGVTMWVQMKLNPTPPDPVQAQALQPDADHLYLHPGAVPGGAGALLGLEQLLVDHPAIHHHAPPGRQRGPPRQHPPKLRLPEEGRNGLTAKTP